jgi:DNA/RNA endonuclease G (NUC1)
MRKFIVHTRAIPGCCKTGEVPAIVEVEGELVTAVEDSSIMWLPKGEFKFKVTSPQFLLEMQETKLSDGTKKKVAIPSVYYSHAVYETITQAKSVAEGMIRNSLEFEIRKGRLTSFSEEELKAKCAEIQEVMLP